MFAIRAYQVEFSRGLMIGEGATAPWGLIWVVAIVALGLGNGMFQDMLDSIMADARTIGSSDHVLAARARGEHVARYFVRGLAVPIVSRALAKFSVFIGATLPVEILLRREGVAELSWRIVHHWRSDPFQGSLYPLVALVLLLGFTIVIAAMTSDLLRLSLDPRQREVH
jgi:ABC-type dipeptide/oligopeptide/nickel transport system permease component